MKLVRSPLAYQGSKFKLLPALLPILNEFDKVHDVFGGSATIALNVHAKKVYYNDFDSRIVAILKSLIELGTSRKVITKYTKTAAKHNLSKTNEDAYYKFRAYGNKKQLPFLFWVMSKHSFCSLLRFNNSGEMNYPFGKRSFSFDKNTDDFDIMFKRLLGIKIHNLSYLDYVKRYHKKACERTVFYFDPPYFASGANVYSSDWDRQSEIKFLSMLTYLDSLGIKWVLSNVFAHRGHTNKILKKFSKNFIVLYPSFNTKGEGYTLNRVASQTENKTVEVIIKNF